MNVLISGASVAGPALAYWLHRYGWQPTVVERAPAIRPGGQAVDLRGTARDAAERMGILADIRRGHTGARGLAFVDSTGRRTATMGAELLGDSGGAIADLEILRGDLVRILYEATRDDVEYLFDDSVTAIEQRDDGLTVTFERSAPRRFDLVVGADGLHSAVRALVFGPEDRFRYDLGGYVSVFRTTTELNLDGWELMHTMPATNGTGGRTAALYPLAPPEAIAMLFFAAPPLHYDRRDVEAQKRIVAEAFAGAGWQAPRLLADMWRAPDFYFDRLCQIQLDRWSHGRVVLLGDAGYCGSPMAGNGTSMALVGAYVLAGELAVAGGDHRTAFDRYEREMRAFVTRCQKFARGGPRTLMPRSRTQIWLRDRSLRVLPYLPWRGVIAAGLQKTANAVTLKDYALRGSPR
jgi:2-polyprenyl-6-methoxyphenol hydroxylase-like FAD-dependent oxidoreductase